MQDGHAVYTDEEIAQSVQSGETERFGVLIERYEAKLTRYGRRFLSNRADITDLVQDIFIATYQNIQSFDPTQKFSSWIYRIAHNSFVNALKKNTRNPLTFFDFDTFLPHPVYENPDESERERQDVRDSLEKVLDQIPQKYKEVLILIYLEELSYKEVADILKVPIGTIGVRLRRGREVLREAYLTQQEPYGTN